MRSFYINLIVETNILNEYLIIKDVARAPRGVDSDFCLLVGSFWESPSNIWFRITRKPECASLC